jgi:hypothetical protein
LLKTGCIQLVDGEDPHTALRAPRPADQPIAAAAGSVGQCSVENLYQLGIACGKHLNYLPVIPGLLFTVYQL